MKPIDITIERGVPVGRDTSVSHLLKALLEMNTGDSFICPSGTLGAAEKARALANKRGGKYTLRATEGGYRFWRIR